MKRGKVALNEGWCLVLAGGGAKGVYHLGVWKALKELGIEVEAFTGASIGAIVAAFLAQGLEAELEDFARSANLESIVALPPELKEEGPPRLDASVLAAAPGIIRSLMEKRGLDTSPLRRYLESKLDERAVRASGRDLGVVTVSLSDLKPRELFLDEMEEGSLVDYVMASAAFPGFARPVIEGKSYVDGGIYDNIPYAMARRRGWRRIIVSDISGMGRNRRPEVEDSLTVYIKNSLDLGGVFDFDRDFLEDFGLLGYLDTMRTFGRYGGRSYFVEPDPGAEAEFSRDELGAGGPGRRGGPRHPPFPGYMSCEKDRLLGYLECAALVLDVARLKAYSYAELAGEIARRRGLEEKRLAEVLGGGREHHQAITAALRQAVAERRFEHCPYFYWRLAEELLPRRTAAVVQRALSGFTRELPAALEYLGLAP